MNDLDPRHSLPIRSASGSGRRGTRKYETDWDEVDNGYFLGGTELTLADLTLFPTFVFMCFYMPRVFGWDEDNGSSPTGKGVFYKRPHLRDWYFNSMLAAQPEAAALAESMIVDKNAKWQAGAQDLIVAETNDKAYKWRYP